jgi:hypothetical protein
MQHEAEMTVNGTTLTDNESRMIRLALGFKDDGIALTDQYQTDVARIQALIDGRANRHQ